MCPCVALTQGGGSTVADPLSPGWKHRAHDLALLQSPSSHRPSDSGGGSDPQPTTPTGAPGSRTNSGSPRALGRVSSPPAAAAGDSPHPAGIGAGGMPKMSVFQTTRVAPILTDSGTLGARKTPLGSTSPSPHAASSAGLTPGPLSPQPQPSALMEQLQQQRQAVSGGGAPPAANPLSPGKPLSVNVAPPGGAGAHKGSPMALSPLPSPGRSQHSMINMAPPRTLATMLAHAPAFSTRSAGSLIVPGSSASLLGSPGSESPVVMQHPNLSMSGSFARSSLTSGGPPPMLLRPGSMTRNPAHMAMAAQAAAAAAAAAQQQQQQQQQAQAWRANQGSFMLGPPNRSMSGGPAMYGMQAAQARHGGSGGGAAVSAGGAAPGSAGRAPASPGR